ncbi:alpha/beta fold hydrolase, partial [Deinococcus aquaticus]
AAQGDPDAALRETLRLITFFGLGADGMDLLFRGEDVNAYLRTRTATADLRHVLDIGRAVQTHDLLEVAPLDDLCRRWREHGTRLLSVNVRGDQFFPAAEMRDFAAQTRAAGVAHTHLEFDSPRGHLGGLTDTAAFEDALRDLLSTAPMPPALDTAEVHHV